MRALIITDVQNDFCDGGALAVLGGAAVARSISEYLSRSGRRYAHVVATQDWHIDPGEHFSDHPNYRTSWPPHCRADSPGAMLHPDLDTSLVENIFKKGQYGPGYSGFDAIDDAGTSLDDWLRRHDIDSVDVVGIATDYCVRHTAEDAVRAGYTTAVLPRLTAGVAAGSTAAALIEMRTAGITILEVSR